MTTRDPCTGRFVSTANVPSATDGRFETETEMPVEFEGADPNDLAYGTEPCYAPTGDELAQGGSRFPPHPRHPVLVSIDEGTRTRYGAQGALTRDAAPLHGLSGTLGYVLGIDDTAGPATNTRETADGD